MWLTLVWKVKCIFQKRKIGGEKMNRVLYNAGGGGGQHPLNSLLRISGTSQLCRQSDITR